jgi:hypothetical protein
LDKLGFLGAATCRFRTVVAAVTGEIATRHDEDIVDGFRELTVL